MRETGIGHGAERYVCRGGQLAQYWKQKLRADGAVGAYRLHVERFQLFPGFGRARAAKRGALFGIGELRDYWQPGERADCVDRGDQLVEIAESFQNKKIHAALFECGGLLAEDGLHFFGGWMLHLLADSERADGAGEENFVARGFACFAGDFHTTMNQLRGAVVEAGGGELITIGAESVGLEDLRAGVEIGLMDAEYGFGLRRVQLFEAALRAGEFVEHRAHGAIGDEDRVLQSFVEFFNFHL